MESRKAFSSFQQVTELEPRAKVFDYKLYVEKFSHKTQLDLFQNQNLHIDQVIFAHDLDITTAKKNSCSSTTHKCVSYCR